MCLCEFLCEAEQFSQNESWEGVNVGVRPDICIIKGLSVGMKAKSELTAS